MSFAPDSAGMDTTVRALAFAVYNFIRRRTGGHLGYGAEPYVCAGMASARIEGEAILRGPASLPVRVVAA